MKLGIDLGGSKIEIIALEKDAKILHRQRTETPRGSYQVILKTINNLIANELK
jgi:fructokinase